MLISIDSQDYISLYITCAYYIIIKVGQQLSGWSTT